MANGPELFVLEVYRQAWAQSRHNELLREGTAAAYAAVTVGVLTAVTFRQPEWRWVPFLSLSVLWLFGFLLSVRFCANARRWTEVQRRIQRAHAPTLRDANLDPENLAPDRLPWLRADYLFSALFAFAFVVFVFLTELFRPALLSPGADFLFSALFAVAFVVFGFLVGFLTHAASTRGREHQPTLSPPAPPPA